MGGGIHTNGGGALGSFDTGGLTRDDERMGRGEGRGVITPSLIAFN